MIKFRQHIPGTIECDQAITGEVESLDELLNLDFIKNFSSDKDFVRFSISKHEGRALNYCLMAEVWPYKKDKKGFSWWVVAYLDNNMGLPEWDMDVCLSAVRE